MIHFSANSMVNIIVMISQVHEAMFIVCIFSLSFRLFKFHWSILKFIILSSLINIPILNLPNTLKNIWYYMFLFIILFFCKYFYFYCLEIICNKRILMATFKVFSDNPNICFISLWMSVGSLFLFKLWFLFLLHVFLLYILDILSVILENSRAC